MTPQSLSRRVIMERLAIVEQLLKRLQALPLDDSAAFFADARNLDAAESLLRRSLEALVDIGRHILAKGFGRAVSEYREVGPALGEVAVLNAEDAATLSMLARYRNRMVHFYHEVTAEELYSICAHELADVQRIGHAYLSWLDQHSAVDE